MNNWVKWKCIEKNWNADDFAMCAAKNVVVKQCDGSGIVDS